MLKELRRHIMMQQGGGGYIQDGLILWLDGRDFVSGGDWVDRINNVHFIKATGNALNVDGGVYINKNDNFKTNNSYISGARTIEACFRLKDASSQYIYVSPSWNFGTPTYNPGYWFGGCSNYRTEIGLYQTSARTFSFTTDRERIVANKIQRSITSTGFPTGGDVYATGGDCIATRLNRYDSLFNGTIYSIRIYNRKLSIEEMIANQQVDYDLFGANF